jgi:hypothetical protein
MREREEEMPGGPERSMPREDRSPVREWLRQELRARYDGALSAPLPDELLRLLPCN